MKFLVDASWKILLKDMGIDSIEVLKRAQLPEDLLVRKDAALSIAEYFRLWESLDQTSNDPLFPLTLGQAVTAEAFHPVLFSALCSPNLNIAMSRVSKFKKLIGPLTLDVNILPESTTLTLNCLDSQYPLPSSLIATEFVFLVNLVRMATRETVKPISIVSSRLITNIDQYVEFFGVYVNFGRINKLVFSSEDALLPFITENEKMWNFFEPELGKRLSDMDSDVDFADRVQSSLMELLPSGQSSIDDVANKLAISKRTLQRRLSEEKTNFQIILNTVREKLAKHYLSNSELSNTQISFLLGYDDPNSFFRAFHTWTGLTPKQLRVNQ